MDWSEEKIEAFAKDIDAINEKYDLSENASCVLGFAMGVIVMGKDVQEAFIHKNLSEIGEMLKWAKS